MDTVTWDFHASGISAETFGKLVDYLVSANPTAKYSFKQHVNGVAVKPPTPTPDTVITTTPRPNALVQLPPTEQHIRKSAKRMCRPALERELIRAVLEPMSKTNGCGVTYDELRKALVARGFSKNSLSQALATACDCGLAIRLEGRRAALTDYGRGHLGGPR